MSGWIPVHANQLTKRTNFLGETISQERQQVGRWEWVGRPTELVSRANPAGVEAKAA